METKTTYYVGDEEPPRDAILVDADDDEWRYSDGSGDQPEGWWFSHVSYSWDAAQRAWGSVFPLKLVRRDGGVLGPNQVATETDAYIVKDSGVREEYANGFIRDTEDGKPDFSALFTNPQAIKALANPDLQAFLCTPGSHLVPFDVFMPRVAEHMRKGAEKYGESNWRQATGAEPVARFGRSLDRHFLSYRQEIADEDHAAAVFFNLAVREIKREENAHDDTP